MLRAGPFALFAATLLLAGCTVPEVGRDDGPRPVDTQSTSTNRAPTARANAVPPEASVGEEVRFDGGTSNDPDGGIRSYRWDFGDGTVSEGPGKARATHAYAEPGAYLVSLTVLDDSQPPLSGSVSVGVAVHLRQPLQGAATAADAATGTAGQGTEATFLVKPGAAALEGSLNLTSAPGVISRVTLRLLDPEGGVAWTALREVYVVPDHVTFSGDRSALGRLGLWRFEAVAEAGSVTLDGELQVRYAANPSP